MTDPKMRAAARRGLVLVLVGIPITFASTWPNVVLSAHVVGDLFELVGTALAVGGLCVIIRALSGNRYVHAFIYAAAFLLVLARLADFTQELSVMSTVPFFGADGFGRGGFTHIVGMLGYMFILLTTIAVLFELAMLRTEAEVEHRRFRELYDSSVLLARTADMAGDAVFGVDMGGTVRTWNRGAEKLFGHKPADIIGAPMAKLLEFSGADGPVTHEELVEAVHRSPLPHMEMIAHRQDGTTFLASATISLVPDADGHDAGISVVVRDVEQQKVAERELVANRNILAGALKHADVGAFISGRDDSVIEFNERMGSITGYNMEEIHSLRQFGAQICDPAARVVETIIEKVFRKGETADFRNLTIFHRDGTERICNLSVTPVRDEDERIVAAAGIAVDVTEREFLQARLLQAQKMESIGRLAGGIAHDFNNILGGILGYASLLVETLDQDSEHQRYARAVEESAARAADLTKQLLAFAKGNDRHVEPVSLNKVIDETIRLFPGGMRPNITLDVEKAEDLDSIDADPSQMHQVILNLCINSRDAIADVGRIVVRTENIELNENLRRRLRLGHAKRFVRLTVEDNGCGMPQEVIQRAYEPFFSTKAQGQGFGLGMSVVYGIVDAHDGTINIESETGKGTRVEVYFPSSGKVVQEPPQPAPATLRGFKGSETILVVDDEQLIRALVQDVFGSAGYTVLEASSGEEAISLFEQRGGDIDLVILDLIMPGMGGAAALKRMQEQNPQARIIVSSGYGNDAIELDNNNGARVRFVQKPYQVSTLVSQARELIDA